MRVDASTLKTSQQVRGLHTTWASLLAHVAPEDTHVYSTWSLLHVFAAATDRFVGQKVGRKCVTW